MAAVGVLTAARWAAAGPRRKIRVGYDYVHSVVDDHSRFAYSEILDDEKGSTTAAFFARALVDFEAHSITVDAVMTDNVWNYTHSHALEELLDTSNIDHILIRPHCPWQNGKVERFNRTLQTEWAYRTVVRIQHTTHQRTCSLARALQHSPPPHCTRRTSPDQPTVTNLMAGYI